MMAVLESNLHNTHIRWLVTEEKKAAKQWVKDQSIPFFEMDGVWSIRLSSQISKNFTIVKSLFMIKRVDTKLTRKLSTPSIDRLLTTPPVPTEVIMTHIGFSLHG